MDRVRGGQHRLKHGRKIPLLPLGKIAGHESGQRLPFGNEDAIGREDALTHFHRTFPSMQAKRGQGGLNLLQSPPAIPDITLLDEVHACGTAPRDYSGEQRGEVFVIPGFPCGLRLCVEPGGVRAVALQS